MFTIWVGFCFTVDHTLSVNKVYMKHQFPWILISILIHPIIINCLSVSVEQIIYNQLSNVMPIDYIGVSQWIQFLLIVFLIFVSTINIKKYKCFKLDIANIFKYFYIKSEYLSTAIRNIYNLHGDQPWNTTPRAALNSWTRLWERLPAHMPSPSLPYTLVESNVYYNKYHRHSANGTYLGLFYDIRDINHTATREFNVHDVKKGQFINALARAVQDSIRCGETNPILSMRPRVIDYYKKAVSQRHTELINLRMIEPPVYHPGQTYEDVNPARSFNNTALYMLKDHLWVARQ